MKSLKRALKSKRTQKWLTGVAIGLAVLSIVGGVVIQVQRNAAADKADEKRSATTGNSTNFELSGDAAAEVEPVPLGSVAKVGPDYRVVVSKVTLHQGAAPFLVVALKAKNIGNGEVRPRADLAVRFTKKQSPPADESTCTVGLGKLAVSEDAAVPVGSAQAFGVCINLATNDITGGRIAVSAVGTGDQALWSVGKKVPTVESTEEVEVHNDIPIGPAGPTAADRKKAGKALDKLEDQIKKAKKAKDKVSDQIKRAKKIEGYDKDDLDDLKDAEDDLDDAIDDMEKMRDQLKKVAG